MPKYEVNNYSGMRELPFELCITQKIVSVLSIQMHVRSDMSARQLFRSQQCVHPLYACMFPSCVPV